MNNTNDYGAIRRKVQMTFFQDGLWDIMAAIFLLGWGCTVLWDLPWMPGIIFIGMFWLTLGLKQKFTYPRTGYARPYGQSRKLWRLLIAGIVVLVLGVFLFGMATSGNRPQFLTDHFEFFFGAGLALAVSIIGLFRAITRWYLYGALILASAAANQWLGLGFANSFFLSGGIILITGIVIVIRFFKQNPVAGKQ